MAHESGLLVFASIALGLALTPGPNMIYLVSRTVCQGRLAGLVSLSGVIAGFVAYMLMAAFGITALIVAVPYAYDAIRWAGALYLVLLAWRAVRSGGKAPFEVRELPSDGPIRLFIMGFVTNLLNPKMAVMYLSLLPQFIHPEQGSVLSQSILLGAIQIGVSALVNILIVVFASSIAVFVVQQPLFGFVQRWLMGIVFTGLALRMVTEGRK